MEDLKNIISELVGIRKDQNLKNLTDDCIMDCSVRIFNTFIMNGKFPEFKPKRKDEPATSSQIWRLKKEGQDIPKGLTKREASAIIKKLKGDTK